jgi:uncharacterized Zn ribbon protein
MKCIFCGKELIYNLGDDIVKCESCKLEWTKAEHKDNQDWAIRHTRLLEQRIATLEDSNLAMSLAFKTLNEKFELLLRKLEG